MSDSQIDQLLSRWLGKSARRCIRCGGTRHYVNVSGGLACVACRPGSSVLELIADDASGKLVWRELADSDRETLPGAFPNGQGGRGDSPADHVTTPDAEPDAEPDEWAPTLPAVTRAAFEDGQGNRVDPEAPERLVVVSTRLDWFAAGLRSPWLLDIEVTQDTASFAAGMYRRLDQRYFAWLCQQVDLLPWGIREQGLRDLDEIGIAAFGYSVFGGWVLDRENWPRRPPVGYLPPRPPPRGPDTEMSWIENGIGRSVCATEWKSFSAVLSKIKESKHGDHALSPRLGSGDGISRISGLGSNGNPSSGNARGGRGLFSGI